MTDTIALPRSVVQAALEYLELTWERIEVMDEIRAALAQPAQEPDKELLCVCGCDWQWSAEQKQWELVASRAQPADIDEAYSMIDRFLRNNLDDDDYEKFSEALDSLVTTVAQPAQQERKPLTDEQIKECIKRIDPDSSYMPKALKQLARAIEQAHGIGSKT